MRLLLMRHGEAHSHQRPDFDRELTPKGVDDVRHRADELIKRRIAVEKILFSPYVRTVETAKLMAQTLGCSELSESSAVTPDTDLVTAIAKIESVFGEIDSGLVVTHQPLVSRLILFLTGVECSMSPSNLAVIEAPVLARETCELLCVL